VTPEINDPGFLEGQQLERQGEPSKALLAYLKVIARRGDQAPESHLDVGLLYLKHFEEPVRAIFYFEKYLELQPNSASSEKVKALIETAKRDFVRKLAIQPPENPSTRTESSDELESLRRENVLLKAELATIRGNGSALLGAARAPAIPPSAPGWRTGAPPADTPVIVEAPPQAGPVQAPTVVPAANVKQQTSAAKGAASRTYTVAKGDTLYGLALRFYGKGSAARVRDIIAANKDLLNGTGSNLKIGMVLKIPSQ
jgi:nucleoid-associated protein YgaU